MPALNNILTATDSVAFGDSKESMFASAPAANGDPFDQVMSRALSPRDSNTPAAQNRRHGTSFAGPKKQDVTESTSSAKLAAEDSPVVTTNLDAPAKIKVGAKKSDAAGKEEDSSAPAEVAVDVDAVQNMPIQLLAPTLVACLLKSYASVATPKSTANNSAAATVAVIAPADAEGNTSGTSPATVAVVDATAKQTVADIVSQLALGGPQKPESGKNFSAGKLSPEKSAATVDVKTTGWSTIVPKNPEPVEAGAADSTTKQVGATPTDYSSAGDATVLTNSTPESTAFVLTKSHGTSVAKQDVPMKNAEQTNKVAGLAGPAEKVLPGEAVAAGRASVLPGRVSSVPVPVRVESSETNAATPSSAQDNMVRSTGPADEAAPVSSFSDHRSQTLDRTQDLMTLHATRLAGANSDSLQVVIKPDAGTQLSLELRQRGGGIEAQAVLQKGDFENLKQHWPELQQRLEQRGIKLAPLTSDGNSATWSGNQGFKHQPDQPAERESFLAGTITGFMPAGAMTNLPAEPAVQAASSRGWQTWA